jgi:signal transduction histidine kinase
VGNTLIIIILYLLASTLEINEQVINISKNGQRNCSGKAPEKQTKKLRQISRVTRADSYWVMAFRFVLRTSENRSSLRTSHVTPGAIEASLNATGVLVPENEAVVTSPIQARLEAVLHHAGEKITANQPILQLNKEYTKLAYRKLQDEQQLNQNETSKLQLKLAKDVSELQSRFNIKQMQVKRLQAALTDEKYLLSIGGGTEENVRPIAEERRIAWTWNLAPEPISIQADEQQLEQIIINIIKNAFEAMEQDGQLTIKTTAQPPTLLIEDNGPGISPEIRQQLFSPFFSTKKTARVLA